MPKKLVWHYIRWVKDLKICTACGISPWHAGLATENKKWITCKNCLRVLRATEDEYA